MRLHVDGLGNWKSDENALDVISCIRTSTSKFRHRTQSSSEVHRESPSRRTGYWSADYSFTVRPDTAENGVSSP